MKQGYFVAGFCQDGHYSSLPEHSILFRGGKLMFSQIPVDFNKVKKEELDNVILRAAIMGEMDAINFYEQMAALTANKDIRQVLLDIAKEEKVHVGEFQ